MNNVAVVILNWNGWSDTLECVKTIASRVDYRIIIVDNSSTDDSVKHLKSLGENVEIIETTRNLGFSGGNNVGIMRALSDGFDFVWLLNNDTLLSGGEIDSFLALMADHPDVGILGGALYEYSGIKQIQVMGGGKLNVHLALTNHYKFKGLIPQHIIGACMFIRAQVFKDVGLLDNEYFFFMEDTDFSLRARNYGWKIMTNEEVGIIHKGGTSLEGKSNQKDDFYIESNAVFLKKHSTTVLSAIKYILVILNRLKRRGIHGLKTVHTKFWHGYSNATRKA